MYSFCVIDIKLQFVRRCECNQYCNTVSLFVCCSLLMDDMEEVSEDDEAAELRTVQDEGIFDRLHLVSVMHCKVKKKRGISMLLCVNGTCLKLLAMLVLHFFNGTCSVAKINLSFYFFSNSVLPFCSGVRRCAFRNAAYIESTIHVNNRS